MISRALCARYGSGDGKIVSQAKDTGTDTDTGSVSAERCELFADNELRQKLRSFADRRSITVHS